MTDKQIIHLETKTNFMRVEVRPLERKKWHGKAGKEDFSRPKTIEVLYDSETGKHATGLTPEEEEKYSKLLGVNLDSVFNPEQPHPYWGSKTAAFILPNHTVFFETNIPKEYVKVKNMKASKFVANSMVEYNEGKWPHATHVIFDEQEEVSIKAKKAEKRREATLILEKITKADKLALVLVVRGKNLKKQSDDFLTVELDNIIETDADIDTFLRFAKMGREEVTLRATVIELNQKNILTKDGTALYYMGEQIGFDYDSTLAWFRDPANQKMKIAIFEKLLN